ncbi:TetR/AcrR family transcriptional regulator [Sulfuriflexus mobilis]|uniref:TetR/AcrR family transcriptional regulator n=1 Tax=Sulfuriflexus mobilis TaxID=1811807 RepID=UPI0018D5921C|nr:TetR/AcrR family transcriptional regulator [Sulfuriflexus mobilis]
MRHKGINKEETRRKMLDAVGQGFREHGYAGIGVDGLAKAAGVTSGAFYSHFGSKDGAFEVALVAGLNEVIEGIPKYQSEYGADWVRAFAEYYLGKPHRRDLARGCAMATLTSEVVRSGAEVHAEYEKKMTMIAGLVARGLAGGSDEDRLARAWSMLGVLIGGINVSRAMKGAKVSEEVAEAIKSAAIKSAGRVRSTVKK